MPENESLKIGMTDGELERACQEQYAGASRWIHWTSEVYSLGKCLRAWTGYPGFLPLFVYSDHGVGLHSHLFPHELSNPARVHFTWNPVKEQRNRGIHGKKVIQVLHPWVSYRHMRRIERNARPRGTLVFFMHGTASVQWRGHDSVEYFEQLRNLPEAFQPVVLCLHMHDVKAGVHKELRKYGFPLVTAGNTSATEFVDRFYDLVKNFSYASAQAWGSYVAYCVELGLPFLLLGTRPTLINIADPNLPSGQAPQHWDKYHEQLEMEVQALFTEPTDRVTTDQRVFVETLLGFGSNLTRGEVRGLLWREFFRNWKQWHVILKSIAKALLHKTGLLIKVKNGVARIRR